MPLHYPIFLNLNGTTSLVVGGGSVGERKVLSLLQAGSEVRLVSMDITTKLLELASLEKITLLKEPYRTEHLESIKLVFAATNNSDVNQQISEDAAMRSILCNRADIGSSGDFVTPSVIRRGDLCIGFTTGNNFPALTSRISKELEDRFDTAYADYTALLGKMRIHIHSSTERSDIRKLAASSLLDAESQLLKLIGSNNFLLAEKTAFEIVNQVFLNERVP